MVSCAWVWKALLWSYSRSGGSSRFDDYHWYLSISTWTSLEAPLIELLAQHNFGWSKPTCFDSKTRSTNQFRVKVVSMTVLWVLSLYGSIFIQNHASTKKGIKLDDLEGTYIFLDLINNNSRFLFLHSVDRSRSFLFPFCTVRSSGIWPFGEFFQALRRGVMYQSVVTGNLGSPSRIARPRSWILYWRLFESFLGTIWCNWVAPGHPKLRPIFIFFWFAAGL